MMTVELYEHQLQAKKRLRTGSILCGGVGSGKSITSLAYYVEDVCKGSINPDAYGTYQLMHTPKRLYIITTARKRDTLEWQMECEKFPLQENGIEVVIDSWNNISKYTTIKDSFVIFDEQKVIGSGLWAKSFLKICSHNDWILLSATPGDTWLDYISVFVANGFYKNRTEFLRRHVVYNSFSRHPKVERYLEVSTLCSFRDKILIKMHYEKKTTQHDEYLTVGFDKEKLDLVLLSRWHVYEKRPIQDVAELCFVMRRVVNSDERRIDTLRQLFNVHHKIIVFYNFNYELELLLTFGETYNVETRQWNGHKHEMVPESNRWLYLVQYTAGSEGWNCIETNTVVFYSQNYSYKSMIQAAGRIDRLNTPYKDLYYYHFISNSVIDLAILKALKNKRDFNERSFIK